jgi:hypothetical protein
MEVGGCMYVDDVDFCCPVNLGSVFDRIAQNDRARIQDLIPVSTTVIAVQPISVPVQESAKLYANPDNECVICFEDIGKTNNCVTPCGHAFCFKCLVTAMTMKNTCPCCRAELFALPKEEEEDDADSDYDSESGSESGSDDDDDMIPVEMLVSRLESKGFTMLDVVSMLANNYSKTDPKYTDEYIANMNKTYDEVINDIETEYEEQRKFANEDTRTRENNCA